MIYRYILRPLLFRLDPENAHYFAMGALQWACRMPGGPRLLSAMSTARDPRLETEVFGLRFDNPIGLAAGFDKDARWMRELSALGFGSLEVGTLTAHAQPGNARPRLFRVPRDQGLINRMGFNNQGSEEAARRLARYQGQLTLGVNIGKSKITPNELAEEDYLQSFRRVFDHADYVTINVSSPNTPGLRQLQDREPLERLLKALQAENSRLATQRNKQLKPLLLKIAPDLEEAQLDDISALVLETKLAGIIA
ncbi:MAG: quinone-dependent dihydroorotate dehydrogenase, partial [Pirellulaceae bacterium]